MILRPSSFTFQPDNFEDDLFFRIRREQREQSINAFRALSEEHLRKGNGEITLAQVRDILDSADGMTTKYFINDFLESLTVTSGIFEIEMTIAQFPKDKRKEEVNITISQYLLTHSLSVYNTPESIVEFLKALIGWLPEYASIEERLENSEKQKRLACTIALDVLERSVRPILDDKGYQDYHIRSHGTHANIGLRFGCGTDITIKVDLMDDFLSSTLAIVNSLPAVAIV